MKDFVPQNTQGAAEPAAPKRVAFAALHHKDYRIFFTTAMLCMLGDAAEHVISYWVLFETFHSHFLAGFAVISHWLPFLLLSVWFGSLADRYDCRRIIQISQVLFLFASVAWGLLFITDTLRMWHAVVILIVHGMAGALFGPASQLILHEMVSEHELPSAVRLNATSRQLGFLLGPAVGGVLLIWLGPAVGILVNAIFYLPLILWIQTTPYSGRSLQASRPPRQSDGGIFSGLIDAWKVLKEVSGNPVLISMIALPGIGALLIGNAYQAEMPAFVSSLGDHGHGAAYSALFGAHAAGAVAGGFLLESSGLMKVHPRSSLLLAFIFSFTIGGFAFANNVPLAFLLLFVSGICFLGYSSIAQTLVQLLAPPEKRGRVIGVFNMAQQGMRTGSGITVSGLGAFIGIHTSLALSAVLFMISVVVIALLLRKAQAAEQFSAAGHSLQ